MLEIIKSPWPWYIAGPLIGLTVPILLLIGNKTFGISSSLRHICAAVLPGNIKFFQYNWKSESWNLFFVFGIFMGGWIANHYLASPHPIHVDSDLMNELKIHGVTDITGLVPSELFSWASLFTLRGFVMIVVGGFLVGFGTRYAGGCTSGHSISGISNLQVPSIIATCFFMLGGFFMANVLLPFILSL